MTQVPTLETERLTLRAHRVDDFPAFRDLMIGKRARYLGGPMGADKAWLVFCAEIAHWELMGFGAWAVDRKTDGRHIGQVSLSHPPEYPEHELGWALYDGFEGQGYAFEAAIAARDYAFNTLGWEDCVSYPNSENARSIALAERLGAVRDEEARKPDPSALVYRHERGLH